MTTFEIVIICGAVCGVLMVVGGMVLLAIGVIKLEATAPALAGAQGAQAPPDALILEFKKTIKVTAHYPALALFLIGVLFIFASAWLSKPREVQDWTIRGKIDSPDPSAVTIEVAADKWVTLNPNSDGTVDAVIYPNLSRFNAVIVAPGCKPEKQHLPLHVKDLKNRILELTAASVQKVADMPPVKKENIEALPANVQLPPVTASEAFNK
jgi:hypothetical protein